MDGNIDNEATKESLGWRSQHLVSQQAKAGDSLTTRTSSSSSSLSSGVDERRITSGKEGPCADGRKRPLPSPRVAASTPTSNTAVQAPSLSSLSKVVTSSSSSGTPSVAATSEERDSSSSSSGSGHEGKGSNKSGVGAGSNNEGGEQETSSSGRDSGRTSIGSGGEGVAFSARSRNTDTEEVHHQHSNHHHHAMHHYHYRSNLDDGSTLQVPGDDGSDRLASNSSNGIVQPATVVASRYNAANSSSASGGSGGERKGQCYHHQHDPSVLLPPHREPGYQTIRKTLSRFPSGRKRKDSKLKKVMRRSGSQNWASTTTDSASFTKTKKRKASSNGNDGAERQSLDLQKMKKQRQRNSSPSPENSEQEGNTSSSGSGTEGGYAGSASSNGTRRPQSSCSSPSVSSSEDSHMLMAHRSRRLKTKTREGLSSSSEIADFGSSSSETADDDVRSEDFGLNSPSPPLSSSNDDGSDDASDDLEQSFRSAKFAADAEYDRLLQSITRKRNADKVEESKPIAKVFSPLKSTRLTVTNVNGRPPILTVGSDIMAHILTFLQPPEILDILTTPFSRTWQRMFTESPELWRVLCLVEPFKANVEEESPSEDDTTSDSGESFCSMEKEESLGKSSLEKYRSLYTAFVRCMRYLSQIRDDAISGRPPAYIDYGYSGGLPSSITARRSPPSDSPPPIDASKNKSLHSFLAESRGVMRQSRENSEDEERSNANPEMPILSSAAHVLSISKKKKRSRKEKEKPGLKLGQSMITGRLLGPTTLGGAGNMNLPWSCAIYSIVNWMTAYSEVEGIQTLCLKVLPCILEDEQQRQTAQTARLTDIVLRAMLVFPKSEQLNIAAFHTIVLLARPHGGREGMLFHSSMISSGIFGMNCQHGKSGIAVMLDAMMRFQDSPVLLAMSCWALVNIALAPEQKAALVKLGGIQATINAMSRHPFSAEVQFRALFALINLVIPSVKLERRDDGVVNFNDGVDGLVPAPEHFAAGGADVDGQDANSMKESDIINGQVGEITSLVVRAMKNFCSSEAILNRACLVLHNLTLTEDYHTTLLWTPQCYQMLDWCVMNYRTDQVLQQSATGTLHRLRLTLAQNDDIRTRFRESLRTQQHIAVEQAQKEAQRLNEQQQALLANAREAAAAAASIIETD